MASAISWSSSHNLTLQAYNNVNVDAAITKLSSVNVVGELPGSDPAVAGEAVVLFGPEGGVEEPERAVLDARGWRAASLAGTTLRFETAGIAAIAVLRAAHLGNF